MDSDGRLDHVVAKEVISLTEGQRRPDNSRTTNFEYRVCQSSSVHCSREMLIDHIVMCSVGFSRRGRTTCSETSRLWSTCSTGSSSRTCRVNSVVTQACASTPSPTSPSRSPWTAACTLRSSVSAAHSVAASERLYAYTCKSMQLSSYTATCIFLVLKLDGSTPVKYGIRLNPDDKYRALKKQLSGFSGLDPSQLLLVEVFAALIRVRTQSAVKVFCYCVYKYKTDLYVQNHRIARIALDM